MGEGGQTGAKNKKTTRLDARVVYGPWPAAVGGGGGGTNLFKDGE